ncbi:MAG: hypothetical protein QM488_14575 [Rhizobiaceae bacterium]
MKLAINIAFAIIVILLFSLLVQGKPAGAASIPQTEQARLQTIIDDNDFFIEKLRAESETGKLLADYIVLAPKIWVDTNLVFSKDTPDDIIPNYLVLKMLSGSDKQVSKKTIKAYLVKLHKLNRNNSWFKEANFQINSLELIVNVSEQRNFWWRAPIVKNLRYLSLYDEKMREAYVRSLNSSNGWVQKREFAFWQEELGRNVCEGVKYEDICISKLEAEFKTLQLKKQQTSIMNLICLVTIIRSEGMLRIRVC